MPTRTQIGCKVIADSLSPSGARLFTVECVYPWYIHNELMTHRMLSRNAASSRAIPIEKRLERVLTDPVIPTYWGANQKGMVADNEVKAEDIPFCRSQWIQASQDAVARARVLAEFGVHKQTANRLVEPFCWMTSILSATEWANFFWLRCHKDAQPEMRQLAMSICRVYFDHEPERLTEGEWHLPYITEEDRSALRQTVPASEFEHTLSLVSVGRCARVSYLTHDGRRDIKEDIALAERLATNGHWSPFEHVAQACSVKSYRSGNFLGWVQFRQLWGDGRDAVNDYLSSPEEYFNRV